MNDDFENLVPPLDIDEAVERIMLDRELKANYVAKNPNFVARQLERIASIIQVSKTTRPQNSEAADAMLTEAVECCLDALGVEK